MPKGLDCATLKDIGLCVSVCVGGVLLLLLVVVEEEAWLQAPDLQTTGPL